MENARLCLFGIQRQIYYYSIMMDGEAGVLFICSYGWRRWWTTFSRSALIILKPRTVAIRTTWLYWNWLRITLMKHNSTLKSDLLQKSRDWLPTIMLQIAACIQMHQCNPSLLWILLTPLQSVYSCAVVLTFSCKQTLLPGIAAGVG